MIEIEKYNDRVTSVKTATEMGGKAIMWAYSYLIDRTLIDAGCGNAQHELIEFTDSKNVDTVYVTHSHEDHVGGCGLLSKNARIIAPSFAIDSLRNPPIKLEFFAFVWGQVPPVEEVETMPSKFDIGDLTFEVVSLPGHFIEGMVGFLEPNLGWFFSADGVPLPSRKRLAMDDENVSQVITTMEKIKELDIKVLFDSHRGPIVNPQEHIQIRIDYLRDVQTKSKELHEEGKSIEEIVNSFGFEVPWYVDQTEGRFGVDHLIRSLIFDDP